VNSGTKPATCNLLLLLLFAQYFGNSEGLRDELEEKIRPSGVATLFAKASSGSGLR